MISLKDRPHVHRQEVTVFQLIVIRYSVNDDIVGRGTDRRRITVVAEKRGSTPGGLDHPGRQAVELFHRHSGRGRLPECLEDVGHRLAGSAHLFERRRVLDRDHSASATTTRKKTSSTVPMPSILSSRLRVA